MSVTVEPFAGAPADWDRLVGAAPGGTHFHRIGWLNVIERVHGHECLALAARAPDGSLAGVLPLVHVRSLLFGRYLVSMPFVNYGGPLGTDEAVRALAVDAVARAREKGAKLLELRSRRPLPLDLPASHRKVTALLDLPAGGPEVLWDAYAPKMRTKIRRPQKDGVTMRFGRDQLEPFFRVFAHHMRDLGTPTQPLRFFEAIAAAFGGDVWFGCAWLNDVPIAAGCGFRWADEFEITWSSALTEYRHIKVTMFLFWSFIERAAREGLRVFNFGRSSPGSGTNEFKRQWGTRDEQLWWYQDTRGGIAATPSPDQESYAWGPRIWKRIPRPLANTLGPLIVRGIP